MHGIFPGRVIFIWQSLSATISVLCVPAHEISMFGFRSPGLVLMDWIWGNWENVVVEIRRVFAGNIVWSFVYHHRSLSTGDFFGLILKG